MKILAKKTAFMNARIYDFLYIQVFLICLLYTLFIQN